MKEDAKDALGRALQSEELQIEDVKGKLVVGNRRGLNMAASLDAVQMEVDVLKATVASQGATIASQGATIASQGATVASLEERVVSLASSLDAYKRIRSRFISTYKRDKLGITTDEDQKIISEGNGRAHGGDAVVDAKLYEGMTRRRDPSAFKKLYGVTPGEIAYISEFFAILRKC